MNYSLPGPSVGSLAPAFQLADADGHQWRLGDHRGETVVVIFHRHIN